MSAAQPLQYVARSPKTMPSTELAIMGVEPKLDVLAKNSCRQLGAAPPCLGTKGSSNSMNFLKSLVSLGIRSVKLILSKKHTRNAISY